MERPQKKHQVLRLLQENRDTEFTACQINAKVNTSDARKCISRLKREGYPIFDRIINKSNGTKAYYYAEPKE